MYQINTIYTLNFHNVICQLYLNNTGGGGNIWIKLLDFEEMVEKIIFLAFRQGQSYLNREDIQIVIRLFSSNALCQKKMK